MQLRPREDCRYDLLSLGEVMLRLDPGDGRIATTRSFQAWEGGGEYNVARGLRRCFGQRTAVVTALVDNPVGRLLEDLILQGGLDTSFLRWLPFDGVGNTARNGINFTERGYGARGALGVSDRANTAASQLTPGDIDWDELFAAQGVRWFHTGGIFAALSETAARTAAAAMASAQRHGTVVSYDLNYRASLWQHRGRPERAQQVNRELAQHVDVMIGNEEDFTAALGFDLDDIDANFTQLHTAAFRQMISRALEDYPQWSFVATTLRRVQSATINDWSAICWHANRFYEAERRTGLHVYDRVGGGDSFASGLIYALLAGNDPQTAVEYGAAHGALAMTTPGDTSMATLAEVEALMTGASARIVR
jgi:2-dehydro-3-deoxygluconokinase